jgi:hypothetical protein
VRQIGQFTTCLGKKVSREIFATFLGRSSTGRLFTTNLAKKVSLETDHLPPASARNSHVFNTFLRRSSTGRLFATKAKKLSLETICHDPGHEANK